MPRACASAFGPDVRINCVAPGLVETEMVRVLSAERIEELNQVTPAGRMGRPDEIADLIVYLLSEKASFITGETVAASGGRVTLP